MAYLIADSGSTKCEWCLVDGEKQQRFFTMGISPYFLSVVQIEELVRNEVKPVVGDVSLTNVYYYGTGCKSLENRNTVQKAISEVFPGIEVFVHHDLMGASRALCGNEQGIACILGTGSNSCYFDGRVIRKNSPGLGYVLGDEGSGAYLGKKVLQYYLYDTFDEDLKFRFTEKFPLQAADILDHVYKRPLPNKFLASFTLFLAENRGHFMIENIIEDGLNDFFFQHICKYGESWRLPIHFVGSVAFGFKDVLADLCSTYEFEMGRVLKNPMDGLIHYHAVNIEQEPGGE